MRKGMVAVHTFMEWEDISIQSETELDVSVERTGADCVRIDARWDKRGAREPFIEICFGMPLIDIQYAWYPACGKNRSLRVDWMRGVESKISSSAPVYCFFNAAGRNRFTLALSDALTNISCAAGVREEDGTLACKIRIPLDATGATDSYAVTLYRDSADRSFAEALRRVGAWWEKECGYAPMAVPDIARMPMYSCWYSFHQATVASEIEAECARAARLGMDTVIVDDGWQTDDGGRGYAYCGDWEVARAKIPDMRAHVEAVHALGMRYMLWYSVPFVGECSRAWPRFKDRLLAKIDSLRTGVLDPRYPDARQYLIDTYVTALRAWNLDGFKLDFIDSFRPDHPLTFEPGMDYALVEDAVRRLMTDVMDALRAEKPDILIEFRQSYIGPAMRGFGNMFRVGDCPADPLSNRVGVIDLRLLSGSTAVHSDMLMWHPLDSAQSAARQILSVVFGVPQISVRLDRLSGEHREMLAFWLRFMRENRHILQEVPLEADAPQNLYPLARAEENGEAVIAVYDAGHMARLRASARRIILLNATPDTEMPLRFDAPGRYRVEMRDCVGRAAGQTVLDALGFAVINVPVSGMATLTRED